METGSSDRTPLRWTEVTVVAPPGWSELVAEALTFGPGTSVLFGGEQPAGDAREGWQVVRTHIAQTDDTPELRERLQRQVASLAERTAEADLRDLRVEFTPLCAQDYANMWRSSWRPFRVGRLALVTSDWTGALRAGDLRLDFEPGGAFGTGRHPTTRACLRFLQRWDLAGQRLLDAGTGSGLLAVAAARCGAREAVGFDNDVHALPYARALARDNQLADRCRFESGGFELLGELGEPFDALVANLYSDLIEAHAADLARCLRPGGRFAVSGCVQARRAPVAAALAAAGLRIDERLTRGRWDAFAGRRGD